MGALPLVPGLLGAPLELNFATGQYNGVSGSPGTFLTTVRATPALAYASDASGTFIGFAANVPRITNQGLLVEESRINLFLNSQAPVTQTVTVANASVYTVSVYGTASVVLSNATNATVTQGSPATFTTGSTSLICTVSGAGGPFQNVQVELGSWATSPIVTAAASVNRAADVVTMTSPPVFGTAYSIFGQGIPQAPLAYGTAQSILECGIAASTRVLVRKDTGSGNASFRGVGGTGWAITGISSWVVGTSGKIAGAATANDQAGSFNAAIGTSVAAVLPTTPTGIFLGADVNGSSLWNGYVQHAAIWPTTRITNAQLQAITT